MIAWVFLSPSSWLKPHPHSNGIWRWGLWVTRSWEQSVHEQHWCPSAEGIVLVQVGQLPCSDLMSDLLVFWVALLFALVLCLWMAPLPVSIVLKPCESRSWSFYLPSLEVHGGLKSWSESHCFTVSPEAWFPCGWWSNEWHTFHSESSAHLLKEGTFRFFGGAGRRVFPIKTFMKKGDLTSLNNATS